MQLNKIQYNMYIYIHAIQSIQYTHNTICTYIYMQYNPYNTHITQYVHTHTHTNITHIHTTHKHTTYKIYDVWNIHTHTYIIYERNEK